MSPVLELRNVTKTYRGAVPVDAVEDVTLSVGAGELLVLTGASGAGKSTILGLLGLLDLPTSGTVLVDGVETDGLRDADRSRLRGMRIGFVFQSFNLLSHLSASDNVMTALLYRGLSRRQRARRAANALDRVGLGHRSSHRPFEMSGGEQQRVAVARALAAEPGAILADEPTGNLDSDSTQHLLSLLEASVADGVAMVVATHDPDVAARATRRLAVRDGRMETPRSP